MPSKVTIVLAAIISALALASHRSNAAIIAADSFHAEPRDFSDFFSMPIRHAYIARIEFEFVTNRKVEEILFGKPPPAPILFPISLHQKPALRTVLHRTVIGSKIARTTYVTESGEIYWIDAISVDRSPQIRWQFESLPPPSLDQILNANPVRIKTFNQVIRVDHDKR